MDWQRDTTTPKIHPTQKPVPLLEHLIRLFTDVDDVVIDPVAGSGTTLLASANCGRRADGFEIDRNFYNGFYEKLLPMAHIDMFDNAILEQQRQEKLNLKEKYGRKDNSR